MRFALRVSAFARMAAFGTALGACSRGPSDAELRGWLDETQRENEALRAKRVASEEASWTLSVRGNVAGGGSDYPWPKIAALARTHIRTADPSHSSDVKAIGDYRGILLSDLIEASGAMDAPGPGSSEVTIVAADGFLLPRPLADVRRFPILLAIERDGVPLVRKSGGPVLEIMPHTSHPESQRLYPEGGAFYVTTVIVGTEALAIAVGGRVLGEADLKALPERTVQATAGFRFRWPSTAVKIHGPRLRDVLAAAKVPLHAGDRVLVRRKPRTGTPERETTTLRGADVLACDVLLGLRHGESRARIPAGLGGPSVLAFPPLCPEAAAGQVWPVFVESIVVEREAEGGADAGGSP